MAGSGYPKGGYTRSTDRAVERHDAREQQAIDAAQAPRIERKPGPNMSAEVAKGVIETATRLLERPIELIRIERDRTPAISQKCRSCRSEIVTKIPQRIAAHAEPTAELARLISHAYDTHLCTPVETALRGFTVAEIDDLLFASENELERIAKRVQAIRAHVPEQEPQP